VAFGAVNPGVVVQSVAAGFAEGVSAEDEEAGDVEFVVELSLAVGADHNGYAIIMLRDQSRCHPTRSSSSESYFALSILSANLVLFTSAMNLLASFFSLATIITSRHSLGRDQTFICLDLEAEMRSSWSGMNSSRVISVSKDFIRSG